MLYGNSKAIKTLKSELRCYFPENTVSWSFNLLNLSLSSLECADMYYHRKPYIIYNVNNIQPVWFTKKTCITVN